MKLLVTIGLLTLFTGNTYAQNFDTRLQEKISISTLEDLRNNDPKKLELMTYALDNGMYISENGVKKGAELETISQPESGETYLDLGLEILHQNQYFRIEGTDKVLVLKSYWVLNHELENK